MNHVVDAKWTTVKEALANPKWDFRTIDGLSSETKMPADQVEHVIKQHLDEVRVSNVPDSKGRILYTLTAKPMNLRELIANTVAFVAKSTRTNES